MTRLSLTRFADCSSVLASSALSSCTQKLIRKVPKGCPVSIDSTKVQQGLSDWFLFSDGRGGLAQLVAKEILSELARRDPTPTVERVEFQDTTITSYTEPESLKLRLDRAIPAIKDRQARYDLANSGGVAQTLRRAAQLAGGGTASICEGRIRTYSELADRVSRMACAMQEELHVAPQDRVAILATNSDYYLELYYVCAWVGAVLVPLNPKLTSSELAEQIKDSSAKVLAFDPSLAGPAHEILGTCPDLAHMLCLGAARFEDALAYDDLVDLWRPIAPLPVHDDTVFIILFTGGTTGRAKGVLLTHCNILTVAHNAVSMLRSPSTVLYGHFAPMFHASVFPLFATTLSLGEHHFPCRTFAAESFINAITLHGITHSLLVPSMIASVTQHSAVRADFSSMRGLLYGASPMPENVLVDAMKLFTNCSFIGLYGQTETSPISTCLHPKYHIVGGDKLQSVGQAVPYAQLRVVDPVTGDDMAPGQPGELIVRGPHVMKGYLNLEEQTAKTIKNGWLHSGDIASIDSEGFVFLHDRMKDIVITGGVNVHSPEVESVLMSMPGVLQCAVIGTPHPILIEQVTAIVVLAADASTDEGEVVAHCKQRLASFKCPRKVIFRQGPLPMSGANKVLKNKLREPFWSEAKPEDNRRT